MRILILLLPILVLPSFLSAQETFSVPLGSLPFDMAYDSGRDQVYVSLPDTNQVAIISTITHQIVDLLPLSHSPRGIELSLDGSTLFVALRGAGSVAFIDLDLLTIQVVDVEAALTHPLTYDVAQGTPTRLFVSAAPGSGGFARIAMVKLDEGNTSETVASNRIIRCNPTFETSSDFSDLYIGECFSPQSLYKLDLKQPNAPLVLEDDHGSVSGTSRLELSPDGSRIYLGSGQVLDTEDFEQVTSIPPGVQQFGESMDVIFLAQPDSVVRVVDTQTGQFLNEVPLPCTFITIRQMVVLPEDSGFLVLGDTDLCGVILECDSPPSPPESPSPPNGQIGLPLTVTLNWADLTSECFNRYDVFIGTEDPPTTLLCEDTPGLSCFTSLAYDTTYFWQVVATNDLGSVSGPVWSFTTEPCNFRPPTDFSVELEGIGHDMVFDEARRLLYVTVPEENRVYSISTNTFEIVNEIVVGASPHGADLGLDGETLYVALRQAGAVAAVDLETFEIEQIQVGGLLGDTRVYDVIEARPDRLFVSGNPGSNGISRIVMVKLDEGNDVSVVANNRIIRCNPTFEAGPFQSSLYIGECFSPASLYKLDILDETAPIVAEDAHGPVSGTFHLEASPDGERIYLGSGQVVQTSDLMPIGITGSGLHQFGINSDEAYVAQTPAAVDIFETTSFRLVDSFPLPCDPGPIRQFMVFPDDAGFVTLAGNQVCGKIVDPEIVDCNGNGIADNCDVINGFSSDLNQDLFPDECQSIAIPTFIRGDANDDGQVDIADAIWIINSLFQGGQILDCTGANDANADNQFDISDGLYLLAYRLLGGSSPPAPYPACGINADPELEDCLGYTSCP